MCVKGIDFSVSSIYPLEFWLGYFLYSSISTWRHPINNQIWLWVVLMVKPTDDHSECCIRRVPTSLPCTLRSPIVDLERICALVVRCKGLMFSSSPILLQWQSEAVASIVLFLSHYRISVYVLLNSISFWICIYYYRWM